MNKYINLFFFRLFSYYKAVQSAGAAIAWKIDTTSISFLGELITCWALLVFAFPGAFIVALRIKETNTEKDAKTNEKVEIMER